MGSDIGRKGYGVPRWFAVCSAVVVVYAVASKLLITTFAVSTRHDAQALMLDLKLGPVYYSYTQALLTLTLSYPRLGADDTHRSMSPTSPRRLATLPDILGALSVLQSHESDLSNSLAHLLFAYEPIAAALSSLQSLSPQLDALAQETRLLDQTVSYTARTAQDVGGRVQSLDEEMKRVREASERVSQIIELKVRSVTLRIPTSTTQPLHPHPQSSLSALHSAVEQRDWESATRHCARAMALPLDVISGPFAETAVVRCLSFPAGLRLMNV